MVSTCHLISISSSTFINSFLTVPRAQKSWDKNHFHVPHFFKFPNKVNVLILFFAFFQFYFVVSQDPTSSPHKTVVLWNKVDKLTYLGNIALSTETDINTRLAKAWTATDRVSVIWKSDLTDKMKHSFLFPSSGCFDTAVLMHYTEANCRKSMTATKQECCEPYWTSPGVSTQQNSSWTATYHPSRKLSKLDEPDIWDTAGEVGTNS